MKQFNLCIELTVLMICLHGALVFAVLRKGVRNE